MTAYFQTELMLALINVSLSPYSICVTSQWVHIISVSQKLMCPIQSQCHLVFLDLPNGIL
jgi:hypothetical protein